MSLCTYLWRDQSPQSIRDSIHALVLRNRLVHVYIDQRFVTVSLELRASDPEYVCSFDHHATLAEVGHAIDSAISDQRAQR